MGSYIKIRAQLGGEIIMIEKLKVKVNLKDSNSPGTFYATKEDCKNLIYVCNILLEKVNELIDKVNAQDDKKQK